MGWRDGKAQGEGKAPALVLLQSLKATFDLITPSPHMSSEKEF